MNLSTAIKTKDMSMVKDVVQSAVKIYNAAKPEDVMVDTPYGDVPASVIFDDDTKWHMITSAYVEILNASSKIDKSLSKDIEIAKLIATNAVLRNITESSSGVSGGLL